MKSGQKEKRKHRLKFTPIIAELPLACTDEEKAVEFMEKQRWGDCPGCPRCGDTNVYKMTDKATGERNKRFLWRCLGCKCQYTVRIGTVFEDSRIELRHWCYAFWRASTSKKGVAALEIQRQTGLNYRSALFLMHRIRWAMAPANPPKLSGTVEVDETYVGGKPRFKGSHNKRGAGTDKAPVVALVERGGAVRCRHIANVSAYSVKDAIRDHVDTRSRLFTDESKLYNKIGREYHSHETVKHSAKEYVRGNVHTNTVEGFFSVVKRGFYGVHHAVSKHHLHRYLSHYEFLYNGRHLNDGERTSLAIRSAEGKRLMYKQPIS